MSTHGGLLIIVSAPSGAGKSTLVRRLTEIRTDVAVSRSHTTRSPRGTEQHGQEYYFVSDSEFDRMLQADELAEHAVVYQHRYGTSRAEISAIRAQGRHVLLDIDFQGAKQLMRDYPDAVGVFVFPPSLSILSDRLRGRGTENAQQLAERLNLAQAETSNYAAYHYGVVNDDLEEAVQVVSSIIAAEMHRSDRMGRHADAITRG